MTKKYDYHKRNDYPGERTAEKKRISDVEEADDKIADARVAEKGRADQLNANNRVARKGRRDDKLMESQRERSTAKAQRINKERNEADITGLTIGASIIIILLVGFGWGYMALKQQAHELEFLKVQITDFDNTQLSYANKQIQLHKDFLVLTANVNEEVKELNQYNSSYSNSYQMCAIFAERENNINHAMSRFAVKELVYYEQIAVLADKLQCKSKIDSLNETIVNSKIADEKLYIQNKNKCNLLMDNQNELIGDSAKLKLDWQKAYNDAAAKAKAFTSAERRVIACFA